MNKILVATSIAPFGIENQRKAVTSWLKAGFDVISCNVQSEIDVVSKHFPDVRFVPLARDASAILGKPYPYAYDVLKALSLSEYDICGFINSDIHIWRFSAGLMEEILKSAADRKFLYAHRMETKTLDENDMLEAESYRGGIDIFFFCRSILDIFPDEEYFIGNTIWDYWCLAMPYLKGIDLLEVKNPVFYHIKHDIRWQDLFDHFNRQIADKYFSSDMQACPRLMMKLIVRLQNSLCHVDEKAAKKQVLVLLPDNAPEQTLLSLKAQTHANVEIRMGKECNGHDTAGNDFIFHARSGHVYAQCAIALLVQEMESGKYDMITCESAMVIEMEDESDIMYFKSFYINPDIVMQRTKPCFGGRQRRLGLPLSNVSNQYIAARMASVYKRCYIYAAGKTTERLLRVSKRCGVTLDIIGICDKNIALWGQRLHGYEILPPSVLKDADGYESVLIVSIYENEIRQELKAFVPEDKLFSLGRLIRYEEWSKEQESEITEAIK